MNRLDLNLGLNFGYRLNQLIPSSDFRDILPDVIKSLILSIKFCESLFNVKFWKILVEENGDSNFVSEISDLSVISYHYVSE